MDSEWILKAYNAAVQDAVLQSHERMVSYASDTIAHYEWFMDHMLPFIVREYSRVEVTCMETSERHVVELRNVCVQKPVVEDSDPSVRSLRAGSYDKLTPDEARSRGLTYAARVLVDVEHRVMALDAAGGVTGLKQPPAVYRELPLLEMPVMLRSKYCHTATDASSECWLDLGGYFIIRGNAKVLQPQKVQRINVHLVKGEAHKGVDADIRSLRADEKFRSTSTLYMHLSGSPAVITVDIPFLREGMPVVSVLRLLGVDTAEQIDALLWGNGAEDADDAGRRLFASNYAHPHCLAPMEEVLDAAAVGLRGVSADASPEKLRRQVMQQVTGELLPHVGYDDQPLTRTKKAVYLALIVRRMIDVYLGRAPADDRDFEGYKSVQMSAGVLSVMFRQQFAAAMKQLRNRIYDRCKKGKHMDIVGLMHQNDGLSRDVLKAFSEGEVTVQKEASSAGTSVIQLAQQVNPLGIQTHIQRVSTALPRDGKYKQLRGVDPTQLFVFCPTETPEGHGCGLLQNLAAFAHVRVGTNLKSVEAAVLALSDFAKQNGLHEHVDGRLVRPFRGLQDLQPRGLLRRPTLVFVNSDPVALTDDAEAFIVAARAARRVHVLPYDCSVVRTEHGVCLSSDMGVVTFPLLYLPAMHRLPEAIASASSGSEELWSAMCRLGIVEYMDAWEMLEYRVAFKPEDVARALDLREQVPFTHMAVHPSGFMGTCASSVPWPDHDQAPRVAYQAGMLKQAVSTPATNLADRMDLGYAHTLWYPQRPMADTALARAKRLNEWPMGENLIIAIAPLGGWSQEDSIIRNRASVERGSGRITVHRVFKSIARKRGAEAELFEHPLDSSNGMPKCEGLRGGVNYDKLGVDGLPEVGTPMKNGDVLVGKVLHTTELRADGTVRAVRRDKSLVLFCEDSETYVVDKVMVSTTREGLRTVRVRARSVRIPQEGDKISSRHGQKGTIGLLMAEEDMPYVMSGPNEGMRPDAVINLHSMNGRMTIGKLLEILFSSLGLVEGEFVDASPFRSVNARWAIDELLARGYGTEETMVDGTSGEIMARPWFIGSCFYQMLKHMVLDKVTARQRGLRATLTRQPLDGRANQGGQRFGEMEKDALMAHGAAFALDDRSRVASDAHNALVCRKCGHVGESRDETLRETVQGAEMVCRLCGEQGSMVVIPSTYCYAGLLLRELATCGIKVVHRFADTEQPHPQQSAGGGGMEEEQGEENDSYAQLLGALTEMSV